VIEVAGVWLSPIGGAAVALRRLKAVAKSVRPGRRNAGFGREGVCDSAAIGSVIVSASYGLYPLARFVPFILLTYFLVHPTRPCGECAY